MPNLSTMNDERDPRLTDGRGRQRETVAVPRQTVRNGRARGVQRETVAVSPLIPARTRGVFAAAVATSGWNGLVVFLPILVTVITVWWTAGRTEPVNQVARFAGAAWLLGHDVPVEITGGTLAVAPLILIAAVSWRLVRAGAHTVRAVNGRDFAAVRASTLAVTVCYTGMVTIVAFLVDSDAVSVQPWRAAVNGAILAIVFAALGALIESGGGHLLWHRFPVWLRRGMRTGLLSTMLALAAGLLVMGVGMASSGGAVVQIADGFGVAGIAVGVLSLVYLPTVGVWALAYLSGPGFSVGAETSVRVIAVDLPTVLPPLPLFGAVPTAPLGTWGTLLLGIPPAIGVFYGVQLALRSRDLRMWPLLGAVLTATVTVALAVALLVFVTAGAVGGMTVGAPMLETSATMAVEVGAAVLLGALVVRMSTGRRLDSHPEE